MDNPIALLGIVITLYLITLNPDRGRDWTLTRTEGEPYEYNSWLPGIYDSIKVNYGNSTPFVNGNCSVPHVNCSYFVDTDNNTRIKLWGTMTPEVMWVTFNSSRNLMPITVYFFNNQMWLNIDHKVFQPYFSLPLAISAVDKEIASFTCVHTAYLPIEAKIYFGLDMTPIYLGNNSDVLNHTQVINFEISTMAVFKKYTVTVRRVNNMDFYLCELAGNYLSHVILWK
ncbi:unnamed protein product [Hymenolepis diminuta]|uniref:DUF5727 domain-containing protein n=1 Tax=Hymenolepis diminuta TaxID=6216 RepID=A0A564Y219_HYMDI|nr:unnamed protein product [Hymenolepis diminuta]